MFKHIPQSVSILDQSPSQIDKVKSQIEIDHNVGSQFFFIFTNRSKWTRDTALWRCQNNCKQYSQSVTETSKEMERRIIIYWLDVLIFFSPNGFASFSIRAGFLNYRTVIHLKFIAPIFLLLII
jgi:hypothetical protein